MQEKTPEKKPDYPETVKEGGHGDVGKKGGDLGKTGGDIDKKEDEDLEKKP